jgi:hypothetical protein
MAVVEGLSEEQIEIYLRLSVPGLEVPLRIRREAAEFNGLRYAVATPSARYVLKRYASAAIEMARREVAGLRVGENLGLAPDLALADEVGGPLGGPVVLYEDLGDDTLAGQRLSAAEVDDWRFLLLMLHHLPAEAATVTSSMSPNVVTWWQRSQPAWKVVQAAYADARARPLLDALTKLHIIVGVHIDAHKTLWKDVARRPCHGNPVAAHVVRARGRLLLTEWDGFGLGDPALELARTVVLGALGGELDSDQYLRFITQYLAGMRDVGDETLEERMRVFAWVLPLGYCFSMLSLLTQQHGAERNHSIRQVIRALEWIQTTLGVRLGEPQELLAPLRSAR